MEAPLWKLLADAASCPITISIGGEPVEARSFADWSSATAVESTLVLAEPFTAVKDGACVIENQAEVAGKVALIKRGGESFFAKAQAAQSAGAAGVIIVNDDEASPDAVEKMGVCDETVAIPVAMISLNEGARAQKLGAGAAVAMGKLSAEAVRAAVRDAGGLEAGQRRARAAAAWAGREEGLASRRAGDGHEGV